jgi:hypothetical protein
MSIDDGNCDGLDDTDDLNEPISMEEVAQRMSRGQIIGSFGSMADDDDPFVSGEPLVRNAPKIGRNEPCSCGSGRKFKKCHGAS